MVEGSDHGGPIRPHGAHTFVPKRCPIENNHLPEEEPPWPDGHGLCGKQDSGTPKLAPLMLEPIEREGIDSGSDHQEKSNMSE